MTEVMFVFGWVVSGIVGARILARCLGGFDLLGLILSIIVGPASLVAAVGVYLRTIEIWKD